jgi:hypothetical protein
MAHGAGVTDLEVFQELAGLRREPSFMWGAYERVGLLSPDIFAFLQRADGFTGYLVVMSFPQEGSTVQNSLADFHKASPQVIPVEAEIILSTENFPSDRWSEYHPGTKVSMERFLLEPGEGTVSVLPWKHKVVVL